MRRLLVAGFIVVSLVLPGLAAEPYLSDKTVDLAELMPPPPAVGSARDIADMRAVLDAQAQASDARKAQALTDSQETIYVMFAGVLGAKFAAPGLPNADKLFDGIAASEDAINYPAKAVFGRVRPWLANPAVKPYAQPSRSPSYPSGHATRVTIDAIMLSAMVPEKQREIWARAEDYSQSRIIGGMHYPGDVRAGWRAGTAIAAELLQDAKFRADFDAAKVEIRAALGLAP